MKKLLPVLCLVSLFISILICYKPASADDVFSFGKKVFESISEGAKNIAEGVKETAEDITRTDDKKKQEESSGEPQKQEAAVSHKVSKVQKKETRDNARAWIDPGTVRFYRRHTTTILLIAKYLPELITDDFIKNLIMERPAILGLTAEDKKKMTVNEFAMEDQIPISKARLLEKAKKVDEHFKSISTVNLGKYNDAGRSFECCIDLSKPINLKVPDGLKGFPASRSGSRVIFGYEPPLKINKFPMAEDKARALVSRSQSTVRPVYRETVFHVAKVVQDEDKYGRHIRLTMEIDQVGFFENRASLNKKDPKYFKLIDPIRSCNADQLARLAGVKPETESVSETDSIPFYSSNILFPLAVKYHPELVTDEFIKKTILDRPHVLGISKESKAYQKLRTNEFALKRQIPESKSYLISKVQATNERFRSISRVRFGQYNHELKAFPLNFNLYEPRSVRLSNGMKIDEGQIEYNPPVRIQNLPMSPEKAEVFVNENGYHRELFVETVFHLGKSEKGKSRYGTNVIRLVMEIEQINIFEKEISAKKNEPGAHRKLGNRDIGSRYARLAGPICSFDNARLVKMAGEKAKVQIETKGKPDSHPPFYISSPLTYNEALRLKILAKYKPDAIDHELIFGILKNPDKRILSEIFGMTQKQAEELRENEFELNRRFPEIKAGIVKSSKDTGLLREVRHFEIKSYDFKSNAFPFTSRETFIGAEQARSGRDGAEFYNQSKVRSDRYFNLQVKIEGLPMNVEKAEELSKKLSKYAANDKKSIYMETVFAVNGIETVQKNVKFRFTKVAKDIHYYQCEIKEINFYAQGEKKKLYFNQNGAIVSENDRGDKISLYDWELGDKIICFKPEEIQKYYTWKKEK